MRETKFSSTLTGLVRQAASSRTRKVICGELGISTSLLSQLENGKVKPGFDNLLRFAEHFRVSLDYLVYGDSAAASGAVSPEVVDSTYRFLDTRLETLAAQFERRQWLLSKISAIMMKTLEEAVNEATGGLTYNTNGSAAGFLDDQSALTLEEHATDIGIFTTDFSYDVMVESDGTIVPGKFFPVVVKNIRDRNCKYRFLLPNTRDWTAHIEGFLNLLVKAVGDKAHTNCRCEVADRTLISGLGVCTLDMAALERNAPLLATHISDHIYNNGMIAYIIPPTKLVHGDLLVAKDYVSDAHKLFNESWNSAAASKKKRDQNFRLTPPETRSGRANSS